MLFVGMPTTPGQPAPAGRDGLPTAAWPGLRRPVREARLGEARPATDAAAQAIRVDDPPLAAELLDAGRAVLWSQQPSTDTPAMIESVGDFLLPQRQRNSNKSPTDSIMKPGTESGSRRLTGVRRVVAGDAGASGILAMLPERAEALPRMRWKGL
jgi:hypothetical protein